MKSSVLDQWDDVRLFLALFRTRRLALGGKQLHVDTSTASRRLARLESSLGTALFDRTREGLVPTAAAHRLLAAAEDMERASHSLQRELDGLEREVEGVVKISAPPGVGEAFLTPALSEVMRRHPKLRLEIDASVRQADLSRREADLALRTIRPTGGPLVMQLLTRTPWVPLARPAFVRAHGVVQAWGDVPWVGWAEPLAALHVSRWLLKRLGQTEPVLKTNSFPVQVSALREGLGAALMPEPYALAYGFERLQLSRTLTRDVKSAPSDDLWLVTHEALRQVPRVAAVWDVLARSFLAK